ncbi:MAG: tetratricopeptide repeat protein, partial [Pseudomonadota bacterium]
MVSLIYRAALAALFSSSITMPVYADTGAGSYLAGRQAIYENDYSAAEKYYAQALKFDPQNQLLLESVVVARLALGQVERALPVAQSLQNANLPSQAARIVIAANLIEEGQFQDVLDRNVETQGIGPLVDGLMTAWAHLGQGEMTKAIEQFDTVSTQDGLRDFALYHKAMALASIGDFEGAEAIFDANGGAVARFSRRAALARAEVLSQLDRNEDAVQFLDDVFAVGSDPSIEDYAARLSEGETLPFTHVQSAQDGMAEIFFSVGAALNAEASHDYVLLYSRTASFLRSDHVDAILLSAELLSDLNQLDLAV